LDTVIGISGLAACEDDAAKIPATATMDASVAIFLSIGLASSAGINEMYERNERRRTWNDPETRRIPASHVRLTCARDD
jgi:hypothetical protein